MLLTNQALLELSLTFNVVFIVLVSILIISRGLPYLVRQFKKLPPKNPDSSLYYKQKVSLFEVLPNSKGKIILLGDSLTEQGEWSELFNHCDHLLNRGISGDTTDGLLQRLDLVTTSKPSNIFLMIGINDILNENKPPSVILENYRRILEQIKSSDPEISVVVQSLLPINTKLCPKRVEIETIIDVNSQLQKLAKEFLFPYLDLYSQFSNQQNQLDSRYTLDGVHLNGQGYLLWKRVIEEWCHTSGAIAK